MAYSVKFLLEQLVKWHPEIPKEEWIRDPSMRQFEARNYIYTACDLRNYIEQSGIPDPYLAPLGSEKEEYYMTNGVKITVGDSYKDLWKPEHQPCVDRALRDGIYRGIGLINAP